MIYLLFVLSAILIYREVKSKSAKRKVVFAYASIFLIAVLYNLGEVVGSGLYELGIQF